MRKKVTFVLDNLLGGGAEKVLIEILNSFNYESYDIELLLLTKEGKYINEINSNVKLKYIFNFTDKSRLNVIIQKIIRKLLFCLIIYINPKFIYRFILNDDSNTLIAFMEGMSTKLVSNASVQNKIAWVHTDVSKYDWYRKYFRNYNEEKECYNNFDKIICVSDICKKGFINIYGNKFEKKLIKVFNPISHDNIKIKATEKVNEVDVDFKGKRICYVGRLESEKGILRLLKIINEIKNNNISFKLLIIGDGSQRRSVEKYIKDNNLNSIVKVLGFQKNPYKFMNISDIIVSPSYFEGFSLITAEALILNKVIISTDSGGPNEILNNGMYGLVCKNEDEELKNCLVKLIEDEELFMKYKNIRKDIINEFEVKKVLMKICDVIEGVDKENE